jgi:hypothetical protein
MRRGLLIIISAAATLGTVSVAEAACLNPGSTDPDDFDEFKSLATGGF